MFDIAVIGLGPAGLEAVKQALNKNLKVIAFNDGKLGGTCLNVGCIPTKAILHSAITANYIKKFPEIGINISSDYNIDWQKIIDRKNSVVDKFSKSIKLFLDKYENFTYIGSKADVILEKDSISIQAEYNVYDTRALIIASGSKPYNLKPMPFDGKFILSSDDIYNLPEIPKTIAIAGSGAVGTEWSYIFSSLGSKVILIEKDSNILPSMDTDIQKTAERILKSNNVEILKSDYIESYSENNITLNSGKNYNVDCVLSCVGRVPVLPELMLSGYDGQFSLKINKNCATDIENVYVIGDASSDIMLAHNGVYQARSIVNYITSGKRDFTKHIVPSIVYTHPEIASIGIKEQEIDESYEIKKLSLTSSQKAWCDNSIVGILKLIIKDNLIKGAHIVSPEASSLIPIFSYAISYNIDIYDVKNMIYPHPSYSELISEVLSR